MVKSSSVQQSDDECRALSAELLLNCTAAGKIETAELLDRSALTPTLTGYQLTVSKSCWTSANSSHAQLLLYFNQSPWTHRGKTSCDVLAHVTMEKMRIFERLLIEWTASPLPTHTHTLLWFCSDSKIDDPQGTSLTTWEADCPSTHVHGFDLRDLYFFPSINDGFDLDSTNVGMTYIVRPRG